MNHKNTRDTTPQVVVRPRALLLWQRLQRLGNRRPGSGLGPKGPLLELLLERIGDIPRHLIPPLGQYQWLEE